MTANVPSIKELGYTYRNCSLHDRSMYRNGSALNWRDYRTYMAYGPSELPYSSADGYCRRWFCGHLEQMS